MFHGMGSYNLLEKRLRSVDHFMNTSSTLRRKHPTGNLSLHVFCHFIHKFVLSSLLLVTGQPTIDIIFPVQKYTFSTTLLDEEICTVHCMYLIVRTCITHSPDVSDQNLAFNDYSKPLGTIVGETKLFHLRPLDMKSEVSGPL